MPLTLRVVRDGGFVRVVVAGEIDLESRGVLQDAIDGLERDPVDLAIDLAGVTFVDSQGVNLLVRVQTILEKAGASLTLLRPSPVVRKVLQLTGVDTYIEVTEAPPSP